MGGQLTTLVFQPDESSSYKDDLNGLLWIDTRFSVTETDEEDDNDEKDPNNSKEDHDKDKEKGEKIPVLWYEWKGREGERASYTVLYCPTTTAGNDIGSLSPWIGLLKDILHVNIMCVEYPGYGLNRTTKASEKGCYEAIKAAYNYLTITKGVNSDHIILMGAAIGTGPVVHLASSLYFGFESLKGSKRSFSVTRKATKFVSLREIGMFRGFAGVILLSPMTSVIGIAEVNKIPLISSDMFENLDKMSKIKCPIFIAHGDQDEVISVEHSKKLAKHTSTFLWKLLILEDVDNEIENDDADELLDELVAFIDHISPTQVKKEKLKRASSIPAQFFASPDKIVMRWLNRLNLGQYTDQFLQHGYFDMLTIRAMDALDLDIVGVSNPDDRQKLLAAVQKLKEMQPESVKDLEINGSTSAEAESPPQPVRPLTSPPPPPQSKSKDDEEVKINAAVQAKIVSRKGKREKKGSMRVDKRLPKNWKTFMSESSHSDSRKTVYSEDPSAVKAPSLADRLFSPAFKRRTTSEPHTPVNQEGKHGRSRASSDQSQAPTSPELSIHDDDTF